MRTRTSRVRLLIFCLALPISFYPSKPSQAGEVFGQVSLLGNPQKLLASKEIIFDRDGKSISVWTDTSGNYRIFLTPGTYSVRGKV
jgi:hypothetical protein